MRLLHALDKVSKSPNNHFIDPRSLALREAQHKSKGSRQGTIPRIAWTVSRCALDLKESGKLECDTSCDHSHRLHCRLVYLSACNLLWRLSWKICYVRSWISKIHVHFYEANLNVRHYTFYKRTVVQWSTRPRQAIHVLVKGSRHVHHRSVANSHELRFAREQHVLLLQDTNGGHAMYFQGVRHHIINIFRYVRIHTSHVAFLKSDIIKRWTKVIMSKYQVLTWMAIMVAMWPRYNSITCDADKFLFTLNFKTRWIILSEREIMDKHGSCHPTILLV